MIPKSGGILRRCSICRHKKRLQINKAILQGESLRSLSRRLFVSYASVRRHVPHVVKSIAKAQEREERVTGDILLHRVNHVYARLEIALERLEREGNLPGVIIALREMRETIKTHAELLARATKTGGPVTLTVKYDQEITRSKIEEKGDLIHVPQRALPPAPAPDAPRDAIELVMEPAPAPKPETDFERRAREQGRAEPPLIAHAGFDAAGNPTIIWRRPN